MSFVLLPPPPPQETRHLDAFLRSIMAAAKSSILSSPVARDSMVESVGGGGE